MVEASSFAGLSYNKTPQTIMVFDDKSISAFSNSVFVCGHSGALVCRAYGLSTKEPDTVVPGYTPQRLPQRVQIRQVLVDPNSGTKVSSKASGADNSGSIVMPISKVKILAEECINQCGVWNLNPDQNVGIIAVPGYYRFTLNDQAAVGKVFVSITIIDTGSIDYLPRDLFFGNVA
ncbi:MAG: hypothetical protein [Caudoviricetes sp.]|nr:MAG: hypothetical protein [Caudoviricetes sp.]